MGIIIEVLYWAVVLHVGVPRYDESKGQICSFILPWSMSNVVAEKAPLRRAQGLYIRGSCDKWIMLISNCFSPPKISLALLPYTVVASLRLAGL
jgi:hypothetical protein